MMRSTLAVLGGAVLSVVVIALLESAGHFIYPPPAGLNPTNAESLKAAIATLPVGALVLILVAWAAGSAAGGWLSARIARRAQTVHALVVGVLLMIASIANLLMIPHPLWFCFAGLTVLLPAAYAGARIARGGKPHEDE